MGCKSGAENGKINTDAIDKEGKSHKLNTIKKKMGKQWPSQTQRNLGLNWMIAGLQPLSPVVKGKNSGLQTKF